MYRLDAMASNFFIVLLPNMTLYDDTDCKIVMSSICVFVACMNLSIKVSGTNNIPFGHIECPIKLVKCLVGCFTFSCIFSSNCETEWSYMISIELPLSQYILWILILYMCLYIIIGSSPCQGMVCPFPVVNILCRHTISLPSIYVRGHFVFSQLIIILHSLYYLMCENFIGCLRCMWLWHPFNTDGANVVTTSSRCMFSSSPRDIV